MKRSRPRLPTRKGESGHLEPDAFEITAGDMLLVRQVMQRLWSEDRLRKHARVLQAITDHAEPIYWKKP